MSEYKSPDDSSLSVDQDDQQGGFPCPNCTKVFGREDLLRRHIAREARAQTQPSLDRQKSCFECARTKSRCDLEVPICGRCKKKNKQCLYAPRTGNPNVRKVKGSSAGSGSWPAGSAPFSSAEGGPVVGVPEGSYDSDESRLSSRSPGSRYGVGRAWSQSSGSGHEAIPPLVPPPGAAAFNAVPSSAFPPVMAPPGPRTGPPPPPQPQAPFGKRGASIITQLDRSGRPFEMEDGEETPISRMVSSFAQRDEMDYSMQVDAPSRPSQPEIGGSLPRMDTATAATTRQTRAGPTSFKSASQSASHRNLPPLLTGVRMPGPGSASLRTSLQVPNALDLSGWLDEPVVPSPLYRLGPYSALKTAGPFSFALPGMEASSQEPAPTPAHANAASSSVEGDAPAKGVSSGAARHIWQHGISDSEDLPETLARAAAAHLITYPTLMVLPEATSPVPPFIYRPWLASVRSDLPASLAIARVVLAGYLVRLPSSQSLVWESIAREMRILIGKVESAASQDNLNLFASTAALWLYLVLAILTEEPAGSVYVNDDLVNAGLKALSHLASAVSLRIKTEEARMKETSSDRMPFLQWGLTETMRRTLFAAYTILVLQRFREGALEIQQHLAGCDLVLDIALPSGAKIFDSASEAEWTLRQEEERQVAGTSPAPRLTLRDLISARRASDRAPANLLSFFDQHDEFTNVCLSVALGLDSEAI